MTPDHGGTAQQEIVTPHEAQLVAELLAQAAQCRVREKVQDPRNALGRGRAVEYEKLLEETHVLLHCIERIRIDTCILGM
eukprot:scaffold7123_cov119-Isochrysis_galbana.AAC.3